MTFSNNRAALSLVRASDGACRTLGQSQCRPGASMRRGRITRSGTPKKRIPVSGRIKQQVATEPMALAPVRPPRRLARVRGGAPETTGRWPPRRPITGSVHGTQAARSLRAPPRPRSRGKPPARAGKVKPIPSSGHGQAAVGVPTDATLRPDPVPSLAIPPVPSGGGGERGAKQTAPR
ncbi:MAG: hypothetical protein IPL59_15020 [Candidatus Competibacteraceae bacterium]|nr:hypothetical protein [Candidatus Competibacteraceae bacterium]